MNRVPVKLLCAWAALFMCTALHASPVKYFGRVVSSGKGVPDVSVTDGRSVVRTDHAGRYVLASDVGVDNFGHKMLTGSGKYLENLVKEKIGVKVRSIELNVCQRCSSAMLSATDQKEAIASGAYGVKCAIEGETGKMIGFSRLAGEDYKIDYVAEDVNLICNQEKTVPLEWITGNGSDIGQEFIDYALPLIKGEVKVPSEDGLPLFAYRK